MLEGTDAHILINAGSLTDTQTGSELIYTYTYRVVQKKLQKFNALPFCNRLQ